jgi:hypothetical protein
MQLPLKEIESLLYRLITAPSGVAEGLAAERHLPPRGLDAIVRGDERLSAAERVDIYANMYFYRLLDVMREDFAATAAVLGADGFHNLVTGYLLEYPPTEPSIAYAGRYLADFLRDHPVRERWPFIAELAELERTLVEVFHAADAPALEPAAMRAIAPAEWTALRLRLHPAHRILDCEWKIAGVLEAVEDGREWCAPEHTAARVLVWRRDARVFYREVGGAEASALARLARGATFGRICDLIAAETAAADVVGEINRLLERWLGDGILARVPERRRAGGKGRGKAAVRR